MAVRHADLHKLYDTWIENSNKERLQLIYEDLIKLDISIREALNMKYYSFASPSIGYSNGSTKPFKINLKLK